MGINKSYKIANPEILKILEGCGNKINAVFCGYQDNYCLILCPSCKSILKGILNSQEKEMEFLNLGKIKIEGRTKDMEFLINQRLQALKISSEHLQEVLK